MPDVKEFLHSSALLGLCVTVGSFAIWLGLASAVSSVGLYWLAMLRAVKARARADAAGAAEAGEPAEPEGNGRKNGKSRARPAPDPYEQKTERIGLWGRRFFWLTCVFVVLGIGSLWTLIFQREYTVQYIWKNTNSALPFGFRFASLWSDQEGTFFLWLLYNVVIGSVLLWKAREDERWVMPFFTLINVSLFTLLTFMNPFWMVAPHAVRDQLTEGMKNFGGTEEQIRHALGFLPNTFGEHLAYYFGWGSYWKITDGNGLNESLQNFWMVIHPPTLFVGFSSMIIPACFALGALMKRDYETWVDRAAPWLMFAWTVLGTGIFLGGYWAYETLGWGGYWSWDPVENSSLIPWLIGTTLVHGLLAQRNRGNFKQANLFLGLMAGAGVLLSSFLNRSGVLSEVSVHSFATPQQGVFWTLLIILLVWVVMSVAIWLWRFKEIQAEIAYEHVWERHFGFFLGLIVLSATSIVVLFGVTAPVWMPKVGLKLNIEYTFYNKALLPVAFVMVLLMALTPLMPWRRAREDARPMRPFNMTAQVLAAVFTIFFMFAAVWAWLGGFRTQNDLAYIGFGLILGLALIVNVVYMARAARGGFLATGPWLAHVGFIVTMAGVIITSRFNSVHPVPSLETGESVQILGRKFTFMGSRPAANPQDRDRMLVRVERNGRTWDLDPKVFISKMNPEKPQVMAWPQIVHVWFGDLFGDLYIEPSATPGWAGVATLEGVEVGAKEPSIAAVRRSRNDPQDLISLRMLDWKPPKDAAPGAAPALVANLDVAVNGIQQKVQARMQVGASGLEPTPVRIAGERGGTAYMLLFTGVDPTTRTGTFRIVPENPVEVGSFQVLHIPGIHVLWFGCYIMFAGGFMCYRRRALLARKPQPARSPSPAPSRQPRPEAAPEPAGAE